MNHFPTAAKNEVPTALFSRPLISLPAFVPATTFPRKIPIEIQNHPIDGHGRPVASCSKFNIQRSVKIPNREDGPDLLNACREEL